METPYERGDMTNWCLAMHQPSIFMGHHLSGGWKLVKLPVEKSWLYHAISTFIQLQSSCQDAKGFIMSAYPAPSYSDSQTNTATPKDRRVTSSYNSDAFSILGVTLLDNKQVNNSSSTRTQMYFASSLAQGWSVGSVSSM